MFSGGIEMENWDKWVNLGKSPEYLVSSSNYKWQTWFERIVYSTKEGLVLQEKKCT